VWWPGISNDIKSKVASCNFCQEHRPSQLREPLKTTPLPARPWLKIAADICDLDGKQYLIVTDYYSRFLKIAYLSNLTSSEVIGRLKNIFSRWGIPVPEELVSDNGKQFISAEFHLFAERYHITRTFSNPYYPQSNGAAESAVKIAKKILRQNDIFLALMSYRATPIEATGMRPAEMIMGQKICTLVPALPETLDPA
jgi:transposase InsO family protein